MLSHLKKCLKPTTFTESTVYLSVTIPDVVYISTIVRGYDYATILGPMLA